MARGLFGDSNPAKRPEVREKIRLSKLGKKRPDISEKYKGEGNPRYKNGIRTGKRITLEIKKICDNCGSNQNLNIHHKDSNRENNQLSNLSLLCKSCHSKEHRGKSTDWHDRMYTKRKIKRSLNKPNNNIYK